MGQYLTKEGLEKLKKELEHLKNVTRREIVARIAAAKELGDLKENAEYAEAKDDQGLLEARISELDRTIKTAVFIDESKHTTNEVSIGSTVKVRMGGKDTEYTVVGPEEADPATNHISYESPFGKAFLHKKVGEKAIVKVPKGDFEYEIVEIR